MIGYQWTVYRRHDGGGSDGIVATGVTDRPDKAKSLVEMIVRENGAAAWGPLTDQMRRAEEAMRKAQPERADSLRAARPA